MELSGLALLIVYPLAFNTRYVRPRNVDAVELDINGLPIPYVVFYSFPIAGMRIGVLEIGQIEKLIRAILDYLLASRRR